MEGQESTDAGTVREAVGIVFDAQHLREAIDELVRSDFERSQLGLLAGENTVRCAGNRLDRTGRHDAMARTPGTCTAGSTCCAAGQNFQRAAYPRS